MLDALWHDVRHAARTLARKPGVTLAALVSLALGIGVNAAIFSVFEQVVLRRLPVRAPADLVNVTSPGPRRGRTSSDFNLEHAVFSYPLFRDLERIETVFAGMGAFRDFRVNLAHRGESTSGRGILVSGGYFQVLGLNPAVGRLLGVDDDRAPGADEVVVLSHAYWSSRFGADPAVVNDRIVVNGRTLTIVGVAPREFHGTTRGDEPEVFVPLTMAAAMQPGAADLARMEGAPSVFENRRDHWLYVFARLRPGITPEVAQSALNGPFAGIIADVELPAQGGMSDKQREQFLARRIVLEDGDRGHRTGGDQRPLIAVLFTITGLILLIACANVANLLLGRAADRAAEIAVHVSMGATPRRIVRRLVTEAALLSLAGGTAGLLVGAATLQLLSAVLPAEQFDRNVPVVLFTLALSLVTALLFGVAPAAHALRSGLGSALKAQTGRASSSPVVRRFGATLATTQIALATALLVVTGLFIHSLVNIGRVDLGLRTDSLVAFRVYPRLNGYDSARSLGLVEQLEEELKGLPGVSSVSASSVALLSSNNNGSNLTVEGFDAGPDADMRAVYSEVGSDFFRTLGIPLLGGREFLRSDGESSPKVAIVNEAFARKFNLEPTAVGKRMRIGAGRPLDIQIVGLVRDAHYSEVKVAPPPQFFVPYRQRELGGLTFYVRSAGPPEALLAAVRAVVRRVDSTLPVQELRTMEEQVDENVARDRLLTVLASAFGALATVLAAVGLYGVLAYAVAQRSREIGIRMAIGATVARIRGMVVRQTLPMLLIGCGAGLAGAMGLGRFASSLLFGVQSSNPLLLAAAAFVVIAVAAAAAVVPARRAARIDPLIALRAE
jgi:predicted permease